MRDGVILRDGVSLERLIDRDDRSVSARLFTDDEIYDLELRRVFDRSWLMVAHESEVPRPGDFVVRMMGEDRVIVSRGADHGVHVVLNSCSHKGTQVCSADSGSAATFVCPYHGWVYRNDGELVSVLAEADAYGDSLDKSQLGLPRARVGCHAGFVFATWDELAPSLDDYLGDYRWYLDLVFGVVEDGMEVTGPPTRWVIDCNWKLPSGDNFIGDAYHVLSVHRVAVEIGLSPMGPAADYTRLHGTNLLDPVRGHGLRCTPIVPGDPSVEDVCAAIGLPPDRADEVRSRLSPEQLELFTRNPPRVGTCFPNFSWANAPFPTEIGGPLEPMVTIRTWQPRGPGRVEVWSWPMVYRCAPAEVKDVARRSVIRTFNSSGIFEQDDSEVWTLVQRSFRGARGRAQRLRYRATSSPFHDWPGPLEAHRGLACEDNMWAFYEAWLRAMGDR